MTKLWNSTCIVYFHLYVLWYYGNTNDQSFCYICRILHPFLYRTHFWHQHILSVTWLLFLGYDFILSEANLSYEAKPSAIICRSDDFITYFLLAKSKTFTSNCTLRATHPIRGFIAWAINQTERGKSIKYVIKYCTVVKYRLIIWLYCEELCASAIMMWHSYVYVPVYAFMRSMIQNTERTYDIHLDHYSLTSDTASSVIMRNQ